MTPRIFMAIAPAGWGTGPTQDAALQVCAQHIPTEELMPGESCRVQVLTVPPGAEMDLHCTRIEWPEGNDPAGLGTTVVGYVEVALEEDEMGWLLHRFGPLDPA
jgi:hypothetical protein